MSRQSLIAAALAYGAGTAAATRVVKEAYGAIEIPAEPKRILADPMTVDYLTALDHRVDRGGSGEEHARLRRRQPARERQRGRSV